MTTQRKLTHTDAVKLISETFSVNITNYLKWCSQVGMDPTLIKTHAQISKEMGLYKAYLAQEVLKKKNRGVGNERSIFQKIVEDPAHARDIPGIWNSVWDYVARSFSQFDQQEKDALMTLIETIFDDPRSKILKDKDSIKMLVHMAEWHPYWIGDVSSWSAKSHSVHRQMHSLLRHLFARYEVPKFMDKVWGDQPNEIFREWYIHIAQGSNIRSARSLPFPLTKKMAHHFLESPDDYTVHEGLIHGQVVALGGNERISRGLRGTQILKLDDTFRQSFINFLVSNPMLDTNQYAPILDYICYAKYDSQNELDANGRYTIKAPPQPNFSMNGRSAETLLDQVERWHREMNKAFGNKDYRSWGHSQVQDFTLEEGDPNSINHKTWVITQLLNSKDLFTEGRSMKHCVSSYTGSCFAGTCSIWSLRQYTKLEALRLVTIELTKDRKIVQARGINNRSPTTQEWRIMRLWSAKNRITIASYAM